MVFGKHINRYYLKYLLPLLLGLVSLFFVDYLQLMIPTFYRTVINGINDGEVLHNGQTVDFTLDFVAREICLPMVMIIVALVIGRFLWRICLFGSGICVERDLRIRMFDHTKGLSHSFYQRNKVGDLMSLYKIAENGESFFHIAANTTGHCIIAFSLAGRRGGDDGKIVVIVRTLLPFHRVAGCANAVEQTVFTRRVVRAEAYPVTQRMCVFVRRRYDLRGAVRVCNDKIAVFVDGNRLNTNPFIAFQPCHEIGRAAASLMFERLANPDLLPREVFLSARLVGRESTKCAPKIRKKVQK